MHVNPHRKRKDRVAPVSPLAEHVLFIDAEALVIDKPAGLPVDAPRDGALSLENHLAGLTFGFQRWPEAVHRLDRDTSGCLLLARNPKAHKRFAAAFEARQVGKSYIAVLSGVPEETAGRIDLPLAKTSTAQDGWRMVPAAKGKPALTDWRLLAVREGLSLVLFTPVTGRTHQIRAHALHGLGHGIVGDLRYGGRALPGNAPMLLHARTLTVGREPKAPVMATAPVPDRFAAGGFGDAEMLAKAAEASPAG